MHKLLDPYLLLYPQTADQNPHLPKHARQQLFQPILQSFGTNKTTLCQRFKAEYGLTLLEYIDQLKVKEAKKLLQAQKLSVTEISEKLGFSSIHYFCRHFKKNTGMSPSEYGTYAAQKNKKHN